MKIAITKGTLRVPPTYFALTHAEQMRAMHHFEIFSLVADIRTSTSIPVHDYVPARCLGFRRRELSMPAFMPLMVRGVRKFNPDVIHQHFGTWSVPATHAAKLSRAGLVTTLHGADVFVFSRRPSTAMARWHHQNIGAANKHSRKLLVVSNFLANAAVAAGLDSRKIEVHYQGIDTDYFTPAVPGGHRNMADGEPIILFVGGLSERKGIRDLLRASVAVHPRSPHRLVIAGEGELKEELGGLAGSSPHIELVGSLDRAGIRSLMRSARALVVPSRTHNGWREAAGLVALEAAACGTPVIASDCGGLSEMVVDGQTGILVKEGEPVELAEAIHQMVRLRPTEYLTLSSAARTFAVKDRSLRKSCAELATHYDDVV